MSGGLRRLSTQAARTFRNAWDPLPSNNSSFLPRQQMNPQGQTRSVGNMPRRADPHIEDWAKMREEVEYQFKFDRPTVASLLLWVVAVPVVVYKGIVAEFNHTDDLYKRKRRDFL